MSKVSMNSKRILGVAAACLMLAGWSASSLAQTCTVNNWRVGGNPSAVNLDNSNTGRPSQDDANEQPFRRFSGPCGLRVPIDGVRKLVDDSPNGENNYVARFYVFLREAGDQQLLLFAADDGSTDKIRVLYNFPAAGDLTLRIFDVSNQPHDLTFEAVGDGWHSVEFVWAAGNPATINYSVNGAEDLVPDSPIDTSGIEIQNASIGNLSGVTVANASVDFDDFDSRRTIRPSQDPNDPNAARLAGDATGDGSINIFDFVALRNELLGRYETNPDLNWPNGQSDCTKDGAVNIFDVVCLRRILLP